jgi:hypothetical protein
VERKLNTSGANHLFERARFPIEEVFNNILAHTGSMEVIGGEGDIIDI